MKKLESTFINMVMALFGVTLLSALALGFVYSKTKERIALVKEEKKLSAIREVILPDNDNDPTKEMFLIKTAEGKELECYPAKKGNDLTSLAIKSYTNKGFSGEIWLMVGLLPDGSINRIKVLEQKETPGLGTKIESDKFKNQFLSKNPLQENIKVTKDGGIIDGITAATISSRAYCDAINRAAQAYNTHKGLAQ